MLPGDNPPAEAVKSGKSRLKYEIQEDISHSYPCRSSHGHVSPGNGNGRGVGDRISSQLVRTGTVRLPGNSRRDLVWQVDGSQRTDCRGLQLQSGGRSASCSQFLAL